VALAASLVLSLTAAPAEAGCSKKVTLFSASWCGYCKEVRDILARNEIPYTLFEATKPDVQTVMRKLFGDTSVPRTVIGEVVVEGVDEDRIKQLCRPKIDDTPPPALTDIKLPDFPPSRHDAGRPGLAPATQFRLSAFP
jgi:glutaredoxin